METTYTHLKAIYNFKTDDQEESRLRVWYFFYTGGGPLCHVIMHGLQASTIGAQE